MRAPFQVLVIPYRKRGAEWEFCLFHRADGDIWQFVSGGGEGAETPAEAARREVFEETGLRAGALLPLQSMCSIPAGIFRETHGVDWPEDTYVVPEYAFAFACEGEIVLSREHTGCAWLPYAQARDRCRFDSNRTALYELGCRLARRA